MAKLVTALSSPGQFIARRLLVCAATVSVVILAVRSAVGPFHLWGFHTLVNSPFVSENIFWMAFFGLLCMPRREAIVQDLAENTTGGFPRLHLAVALCVVAIAFVHNLADPFLSDDYIILNGPPFSWGAFAAALHTAGGDGSFRPLGAVYYQLVKTFAGASPVKWHLVGLGLHLLNGALVFVIAWRVWRDKTTAAIASLVFGLHGTRPEAALWTAGSCDLLACACVLGSIAIALNRQASRSRLAMSLALVAVGILFKESAYAIPFIAFWILWPTRPMRQFRTYLIGSIGVCAALFAWRWHLFHGPGGYINRATGQPAILSLNPVTAAKAIFIRIWAVLLSPIDWDAPVAWWLPAAIVASMLCLLLLLVTSRSRVSLRTQLCLVAATCCAVLPAIHLALIGQSELGSRVLYLAGAPFALLIGSLTFGANRRRVLIAAIMLAGMTGILEHNLSAWHNAAMQTRTLCRAGTPQPPGTFEGVFLFQNGFPECVAAAKTSK